MDKYAKQLSAILKTDISSLKEKITSLETQYNRLIMLDNADKETIFGLKKHLEKKISAINNNNFSRRHAIDNRKHIQAEQKKRGTITAEHLVTIVCVPTTLFGLRGVLDVVFVDKPFIPLAISAPLLLSWPISMGVIKTVKNRDVIFHKIKTQFEKTKLEKLETQLCDVERVIHHKQLGTNITDKLNSEITVLKQEKEHKEKMLSQQKQIFAELEK